MEWIKESKDRIIIKSWYKVLEEKALEQAMTLSAHLVVKSHVALMPECHVGYGMPIGGVIACKNAVIPYAVGVDIGYGMVAVETDVDAKIITEMRTRREFLNSVKSFIPLGEGRSNKEQQLWEGFERYIESNPEANSLEWPSKLDSKNLGTLGGRNHFIEFQRSSTSANSSNNKIWLMIHSGSRNLGQKVAKYYDKKAIEFNEKMNIQLPDKDLSFLHTDTIEGKAYIRDMNFVLDYAFENRHRMMNIFKEQLFDFMIGKVNFLREVNIHHNYASEEKHFAINYWIYRKGATSAKDGEVGIIPGSMGTPSYIVKGKGNPESFMSCSHCAGRTMSRSKASKSLTVEECDKAMEGIVHERWNKLRKSWRNPDNKKFDLSEASQAYKDIEDVMDSQTDLVEPIGKLFPVAVIKGQNKDLMVKM